MTGPRSSTALRVLAAAVAIVVVAPSLVLVTAQGTVHTTYAGRTTALAVVSLVVAVGLGAAGLALLLQRSTTTLGLLACGLSIAWLAPLWIGWDGGPAALRGAGLVLASLLPSLVLAVAVLLPPAPGRVARAGLCAFALVSAGCAAGVATVRDPFLDRYCWSDCTTRALVLHPDPVLARRLAWAMLGLYAASSAAAALVAAVRLQRAGGLARRRFGPALVATALAGLALAAYALTLSTEPREAPNRTLYVVLFVARALALAALGSALGWIAVRPRLVRARLTRLAVDLAGAGGEGGLGRTLALALDDPGLRLGYPIAPPGRVVDAGGRPLALDERRLTAVLGEEGVVALIESDVASGELIERQLGPVALLSLGNERLRAELLARLADVTDSRARIVETADAARRRMEHDLHDGAQQRLLALTYDLRVALTLAEAAANDPAAAPLGEALERVVAANEELRDVAHGIFPAELSSTGLTAALESLADVRPLRIAGDLLPGQRYPADVEAAAYAVVVEALEAAGGQVAVVLGEHDGDLRVAVSGVASWGDRLVRVEDRVGAAGGRVVLGRGELVALLATMRAPAVS